MTDHNNCTEELYVESSFSVEGECLLVLTFKLRWLISNGVVFHVWFVKLTLSEIK